MNKATVMAFWVVSQEAISVYTFLVVRLGFLIAMIYFSINVL